WGCLEGNTGGANKRIIERVGVSS
ncbi:hypothetical protein LCGC14_2368430, partial [marine sediment metagenome]